MFRDLPIKRKLTFISVLTSVIGLVLACGAFVAYEQITFRENLVRDLSILSRMVGYNSASALSFEDASSAEQTLRGMVAAPHILGACIYKNSGEVFATFRRSGTRALPWPAAQPEAAIFRDDHLAIFHSITQDDAILGTIYIRADLAPMHARLKRYLTIAVVVLLVAACISLAITARVQRIISEPVSELAAIARVVAHDRNYAVRAVKRTNDELGHLIDGFNAMLAQIQIRDAALQQARDELEKRVADRTAELQRAKEEAAGHAAQLRFIFEAVPVGVSWHRYDTSEHLVNDGLLRITGVPREQYRGRESFRAVSHPDDLKLQDQLRVKLESGEADHLQLEKRYLRPTGEVVWAVLTIKVFRETDGRITQEVCTLVDITERKKAEAERERIQRQLLDVSRQAGMAEVATGVLHNVGNVLNSVNVTTTLLLDQTRSSKSANVAKLAALFRENAASLGEFLTRDPRGQRIPGYLNMLADELAAEQRTMDAELEHLRKHIEHIKEIVAMQQNYARVSGVAETVPLAELVEDALRMNAGAFARHGLEVVRDYHTQPLVTLERHKVLQILVNLIRNAKYACDESGRTDKRMIVRIAREAEHLQISVIDNGVGIPPENLTRIFGHGFTTRRDGHGFGLHSGALAARELGGSLVVRSEGVGRGAMFTLNLPFPNHATS